MRRTFADLERLLEREPQAYQREVERLKVEDPERFADFVKHASKRLGPKSVEDPPVTKSDVDELSLELSSELGWPKERVMAEALLRLSEVVRDPSFAPRTPDHRPHKAKPRRYESVEALLLLKARA